MSPNRGVVLAGLVLVAIAAPLTAYAVAGDDGPSSSQHGSNQAKQKDDKADKDAKGEKDEHATGSERADEASAPGRAHAEAMKAWAQCVADAASGAKAEDASTPPKDACGDKPVGPGRAKHEAGDSSAPGRSGDHRKDAGRGHQ